MMDRVLRCTVTLILSAVLSGCVISEKRADMDMQSAADHADGIMDATLASIEPSVEWAHGPTTTGSCDVTRRRSVMTVVSDERRGSFLGLVERVWRKRDYRIKGVNNDRDSPAIYGQTRDGFGVSLIFGEGKPSSKWTVPAWRSPKSLSRRHLPTAPPTKASTRSPAPTSTPTSGPPGPPDGSSLPPMTGTAWSVGVRDG